VFNVMRFAVHDGPGIRTTVFLKGCPLACWWCHNPESQSSRPEVIYSEQRCLRCGACVASCPNHALSINESIHVDPERCRACGTCVERCFAGARQLAGASVSVADLLKKIERDRVFYEESGGGVTLSGGEPLAQAAFAEKFLAACHDAGIHTALDTCGYASPAAFQRVAQHVDLFLFDLKVLDSQQHRELTGAPNQPILENLRWLAGQNKDVILRVPVIPGCTDSPANLDAIGTLAHSLHLGRIDLLPYHRIATDKYQRLHRANRMGDVVPPPPERMQAIADKFARAGFSVRIGG
jgi:pyruvate formate lyase activating enzyme